RVLAPARPPPQKPPPPPPRRSAAAAAPETSARCHARPRDAPPSPRIIISILLRRFEPEAVPDTPATRQPSVWRARSAPPAPPSSSTRSSHARSRSASILRPTSHTTGLNQKTHSS